MDRIKDSGSFGPGSSPGGVTEKKKSLENQVIFLWKLLGSNQRPPACKAGALNQLS